MRSEFPLPDVLFAQIPPSDEAVLLRRRSVPEHLSLLTHSGPTWELNTHDFLLRLPTGVRMLASEGRTLDVDAATEALLQDALPFVLSTGFGAILAQRDITVLHGAAVAMNGIAYLFCGESGVGKSTLSAALCQRGYQLLNDDVCAITSGTNASLETWPHCQSHRLFMPSIRLLNMDEPLRGDEIRAGSGKYYVAPEHAVVDRPVKLGAIYILRGHHLQTQPEFHRLGLIDSAQALLNVTYRNRMAMAMTAEGAQMQLVTKLLGRVPIFQVRFRRDLSHVPELVSEFEKHCKSLHEEPVSC